MGAPTTEHLGQSDAPVFDGEQLARQTWLTAAEAAFYVGYTSSRYADPEKAFLMLVYRHGIPRGYAGSRLRFERTDLDRFLRGRKAGRRHGA